MTVIRKIRGVPKGRAVQAKLDVVQLGLALVVRGPLKKIEHLGGYYEPLTDYDYFKLFIGGDEWHFQAIFVEPLDDEEDSE